MTTIKAAVSFPEDDGDAAATKSKRKGPSPNDLIRGLAAKSNGRVEFGKFSPPVLIKTGIPELDKIMTGADGTGYQIGTIIEFGGESMSGKTYAAIKHAIEHMALGRRVIFCDAEGTFSETRFKSIGLDTSNSELFLKIDQMGSAESWANLITTIIDEPEKYGPTGLIIVDSLKALIPSDEYVKQFDKHRNTFAHPAFIRDFLSRILQKCNQKGVTVIVINHMVSVGGAMPNTWIDGSSGGTALKHLTRYRLWFKKRGGKDGHIFLSQQGVSTRIGVRSIVKVAKSLTSKPFEESDFNIMLGEDERNPVSELVYRAMAHNDKYIVRTGHKPNYVYRFTDPLTGEMYAEANTDYELVEKLLLCPPFEKRTRTDKSTTGFEYICGRLKIKEEDRLAIISRLEQIKAGDFIPTELDDDNPYEGLDEENKDDSEESESE